MAGVSGQYSFQFNIGSDTDVIAESDLDHYSLIEETGGSLPTFELVFQTRDPALIQRLNEGSTFSASLGDAFGSTKTADLFVVHAETKRLGAGAYMHTLRGTLNQPGYNMNQRVRLTDPISSSAAIALAAKPYFRVEVDASTTDVQTWIQHNTSERRFLNDIILHSDIPGSFPLWAITHDARFRVRDAARAARGTPTASFGHNADYQIDPQMDIRNSSSLLNSQGAYGIEQVESVVAEHRTFSTVQITQPVGSLLSSGTGFNRAQNTPTRRLPPVMRSEAQHANYWECYRRNLASALAYSTSRLRMSVRSRVVPVAAGDVVMFRDEEAGSTQESTESYSGLYFVSKVSATYMQRNIVTGVELSRETLNGMSGSLR